MSTEEAPTSEIPIQSSQAAPETNKEQSSDRKTEKYKKTLKDMDLQMERLKFENQLLFKKLERTLRDKGDLPPGIKKMIVEKTNDVDLAFNTKVSYVEHLERKVKDLHFDCREKNIYELKVKNQNMREEKEKMIDDIKIIRTKLNGANRIKEAALAEKDVEIERLNEEMEAQQLHFNKKQMELRRKAIQSQQASRKENQQIQIEKIKAAKAVLDPENIKIKEEQQAQQSKIKRDMELKLQKQKQENQIKEDKIKKELADLKEILGRTQGHVLGLRKAREELVEEAEGLKHEVKTKNYHIESLRREMFNANEKQSKREQERELKKLVQGKEQLLAEDLQRKLHVTSQVVARNRNRYDLLVREIERDMPGQEFGCDEPDKLAELDDTEETTRDKMKTETMQRMKNIRCAFKDLQQQVIEAALDIKIANQKTENAESKQRSLERQVNALEGMVVDIELFRQKADDYDRLFEEYEKVKNIQAEFEIFKKESKKLTKVNEDRDRLRKELLEEKKKNDSNKMKLRERDEVVRKQKTQITNFDEKLKKELADLHIQIENLKDNEDRLEKKIKELINDKTQLEATVSGMKAEKKNSGSKNAHLENRIEELERENYRLEKEVTKENVKVFELERLKEENKRFKIQVDEQKHEIKDLRVKNHSLESQLDQMFEKYGDFGGLKDRLVDLEEKLATRDRQVLDMVYEFNNRKKAEQEASEEARRLKRELELAGEEIKKLKRRPVTVGGVDPEELELARERIDLLEGRVEILKKELEGKEEEIKSLKEMEETRRLLGQSKVSAEDYAKIKAELVQRTEEVRVQREKNERVLEDKRKVQDMLTESRAEYKKLRVSIANTSGNMHKYLDDNLDMTKGINQILKRERKATLNVEKANDLTRIEKELRKTDQQNLKRLENLLEEWKVRAKDAEIGQSRSEEDRKKVEERLAVFQDEKIEMEESQIYTVNNFLERIKSKDHEIQRKLENLMYKDKLLERRTHQLGVVEEKVKIYQEMLNKLSDEEVNQNFETLQKNMIKKEANKPKFANQSMMRLGAMHSKSKMRRLAGRSFMKPKKSIMNNLASIRLQYLTADETPQEPSIGQATKTEMLILGIESAAQQKEMNQMLKNKIKLLNGRVQELEGSLEGGNDLLMKNTSRLEQRLKFMEQERSRLLEVEQQKFRIDDILVKMEKKFEELVLDKAAGDKFVREATAEYHKNLEEMGTQVGDLCEQLQKKVKESEEEKKKRGEDYDYIGKLKGKIKDLEEELQKCRHQIHEYENDVNYNNKKIDALDQGKISMQKQIAKLEADLKQKEEDYLNSQEETIDLFSDVKRFREKFEILEDLLQNQKDHYEKRLKSSQLDVENAEKKMLTAAKQRNSIEKEKIRLANEVARMEKLVKESQQDVKKYKKQRDDHGEELDDYVTMIEKQKTDLEGKLIRQGHEIEELKSKIKNENPKLFDSHKELWDLRMRLKKADVVLDNLNLSVRRITEENRDLKNAMRKMAQDPIIGAPAIEAMTRDFVDMRMTLENKVADLENRSADMRKRKDDALQNAQVMEENYQRTLAELKKTRTSLFRASIKIFALLTKLR